MTKIFMLLMCMGSLASAADLRVERKDRGNDKEMQLLSRLPTTVIEGEAFVSLDLDDINTRDFQLRENRRARILCMKCACAALGIAVIFITATLARHYL